MFLCSSPSPPSCARSRALFLAAWTLAAACFPSSASAALTFDTSTKLLGGTISGATIPSVTSTPAAAALLGAVGYSTDANLIYGPFEAGFGGSSATATSTRDARPPYPCKDGNTYEGYCPGGMDVGTCEAGLFNSCPSGTVRTELFMDQCGGHANPYHYHTDMVCHYDPDAAGHSGLIGVMLDGRALFGRHETTGAAPADLDACGGHVGAVPAYAEWGVPEGTSMYHYHAQTKPPFLLGCYGPVASVSACEALYSSGTRRCDGATQSVAFSDASFSVDYDLWCPCFADTYEVPAVAPELVTASVVSGASGRWGGASAVLAGVAFSLSIGGLF